MPIHRHHETHADPQKRKPFGSSSLSSIAFYICFCFVVNYFWSSSWLRWPNSRMLLFIHIFDAIFEIIFRSWCCQIRAVPIGSVLLQHCLINSDDLVVDYWKHTKICRCNADIFSKFYEGWRDLRGNAYKNIVLHTVNEVLLVQVWWWLNSIPKWRFKDYRTTRCPMHISLHISNILPVLSLTK